MATSFLKYKEAYIVKTAEMYGAHGLSKDTNSLSSELQQVLHYVEKEGVSMSLNQILQLRMPAKFIRGVNEYEPKSEGG